MASGPSGRAPRRVIELVGRAAKDWRRAAEEVQGGLRGARELSSAERRFVADVVHAVLGRGGRRASPAGGDDPAALWDAWARLARDPDADRAPIDAIADPVVRFGVRWSYPDWIA